MNSLRGQFLIASPHLPDSNFYRSVVLMIQHDDEGAFGVILNRPTENTVSEIWEMITDEPCESLQPINLGGPVTITLAIAAIITIVLGVWPTPLIDLAALASFG